MNQLTIRTNPEIPEREQIKSSLSTVGCSLRERHNADFDFIGFEGVRDLDEQQLHALRAELEAHMAPAQDDEVYKALMKVKLLTKARKQSDGELEMQLRTYAAELKRYPRDATLKALDRISDDYEFFPAWKEIRQRVEFYCRRSQSLLNEIDRALHRKRQAQFIAAS